MAGMELLNLSLQMLKNHIEKGFPVHVVPTCAGSGEGPDHFGSCSLELIDCHYLI
jgi:hypothetical protein